MELEKKFGNNGMIEFDHFEASPKDCSIFMTTKLKDSLAKLGLKKTFCQRKLVREGVKVTYKTNHYEGNYGSFPAFLEVRIRTTKKDQEKAMEVYNLVEKYFDIFEPPIISECGKRKIGNHVPGNHIHPRIQ